MNPDLTVKLKTTTISTPVILLSGTVSIPILSFLNPGKVGIVVLKTVTLEPKEPNPAPRIYDAGFGVINSIGLFNPGVMKFFKQEYTLYRELDFRYAISLAGFSKKTFMELIDLTKEKAVADDKILGIELNFSCPNVKQGGISFSRSPDLIRSITSHVSDRFEKEVWVKVTPASPLKTQLKAAEDGGATAVVIANTMPATSFIIEEGKSAIGAESGGLSGPALRPINLELVRQAKQISSLPIIASGGIGSFKDVLEYTLAGAQAFGIGTALFKDPRIPEYIINDLEKFLKEKGLGSFDELISDPRRLSLWTQESES